MVDQIKQIATEAASEIIINQLQTKIMQLEMELNARDRIIKRQEKSIKLYLGK